MNDITITANDLHQPLKGDPKRQAVDTWRGYVYQIWQSVYAWVKLDYDTILCLEGAEDFDKVSRKLTEAVQIKAVTENITLNSSDVFEAIIHYWQLREKHRDRTISFRFLTLSNIGLELDSPLGKDVKGLELWQRCSEDAQALQKLRHFLLHDWEGFKFTKPALTKLKKAGFPDEICQNLKPLVKKKQQRFFPKNSLLQEIEEQIGQQRANKHKDLILKHVEKIRLLPNSLRIFLSQADDQTLLEQLIKPIKWETGSKNAKYIEEEIKRKLIRYGSEKYDYPPSDSIKVVDRLLREVIENLCHKEQTQRILDKTRFEEIFENETKRSISYQEAREYQYLLRRNTFQLNGPLFADISPKGMALSGEGSYFIRKGIPSLPKNVFPRPHIVTELNTHLSQTGFLVLTGSSGLGKTTIAKMIGQVGQESDENWYWLDPLGAISEQIAFIFHQLASLIDQIGDKINIVFDALDLSTANFQKYGDYLGGLLYTLSKVHGKVIITSQKPLPQGFLRNLDIHPLSIRNVPYFEEKEILKFALQLGCPEKQLAMNWAKIIFSQAQGHPQFVHGRLSYLANMQWPEPDAETLLTTPPDIIQEQTEIRALLSQQLSPEQRELIYRLSVIHGKFRRDHVLKVGDIIIDTVHPELSYPGNVFDQLIGPWIETMNMDYYQVSPLLKDAAEKDWSEQKTQALHAALGQVFLQSKPFTNIEATNAFFHAWSSQSVETLVPLIQSFLTAHQEAKKYVAYDLSWFIHVGSNPQRPLFPGEIWFNGMLRLFQFEIAVEVAPEKASLIADIWDMETVPHEPHESFLGERCMLAAKILIHTQVKFPPKRLLNLLVEIAKIEEQSEEIMRMCHSSIPPRLALINKKKDTISVLFSFIVHRCSDRHFLEELLNGLEEVPNDIRKRMFAIFKAPKGYEKILTNSVWMHEADSETPEWIEGIQTLYKMIEFATHWNIPSLVFESARAIAIIYDEYLHNSSKALSTLEEITAKFGSSSNILDYARAQIFFNHKEYADVLSVLEPILPGWIPATEYDDNMPIFACRMAGISAAHLNDWQKAADFFMEGYQRARIFTWWKVGIIGFLADAGFARWKVGQFSNAVPIFKEVMECLEQLPNLEDDLGAFTVRKSIEHVLLWIMKMITDMPIDLEVVEPPPGFCSNPRHREQIRELPLIPLALSWAHLAEIEFHLKLEPIVFRHAFPQFVQNQVSENQFFGARAQLLLAELDVRYAFRNLQFDNLPVQLSTLQTFSLMTGKSLALEKETFQDSGINIQIDEQVLSDPKFITEAIFMALVALVATKQFTPVQLELWRDNVKNVLLQSRINQWLDLARELLSLENTEAISIMRDKDEDSEWRLFATLRICFDEHVQPEALFYAHSLLVSALLTKKLWIHDIDDYLAQMLSQQWLNKCQTPALLNMPRVTVPAITSACKNNGKGLLKVSNILLAVSNAVSVKLPQDFIMQLRSLTSSGHQ